MGTLLLLAGAGVLLLFARRELTLGWNPAVSTTQLTARVLPGWARPRVPAVTFRLRTLVLLGAGCELVYLWLLWVFPLLPHYSIGNDMAGFTGHSVFGFVTMLAAFGVLFTLFGLACWGAGDDGRRLRVVLGFGALFALTMTFVYPITAIDIFAYIGESIILTQYHQNPIFVPPAHFPADPIMSLADGWAGVGAPYGPLGIGIDALPSLVAGHNLLANLILLKLMFSAMAVLSAALAYRILQRVRPEWALRGALLVAWNPLVLFQSSANGHNDTAMVFFAMLALWQMAEDRLLWGFALIVAATLVKFGTGLLVPLFLVYALARQPTLRAKVLYAVQAVLAALVLCVVLYAPFWRGPGTLSLLQMEDTRHIEAFGSVLSALGLANVGVDQATLGGRILFLPLYLLTLWLAAGDFTRFVRGCFLAMFFFLAVGSANFEVWYGLWAVIIAAAAPWPAAWVAAGLLGFGSSISAVFYDWIWPWMGLGNPNSFPLVNNLSYAVSFVPAVLALLVFALWKGGPGTMEAARGL